MYENNPRQQNQQPVNNPFGSFMGGSDPQSQKSADMNSMAANMMKDYAMGKINEQYEENKGYLSYFSLDSLKVYFDVTNSYVLHKLKIIVFPFLLKEE